MEFAGKVIEMVQVLYKITLLCTWSLAIGSVIIAIMVNFAFGAEPALIEYTTSGAYVFIEQITKDNNPDCPEGKRVYKTYDKLVGGKCGEQRRYRFWTCSDKSIKGQGTDVEHLPEIRCR